MSAENTTPRLGFPLSGKAAICAAVLGSVLLGGCILVWKFPFRRQAVVKYIESGTGDHVEMGSFHRKWFPPGFTAARVRLSDNYGDLLTIADVTLTGSYMGMVRSPKTLTEVEASGLHLVIGAQPHSFLHSDSKRGLMVGRIRLQDAELNLLPEFPGTPPLTFVFHELRLEHLDQGKATFHVSLHNPKPPGEIQADGQFGSVDLKNPGRTELSGAFTFEHADLTVRHAISGMLNATGRFYGRLGQIECEGTADVPNFQVSGSSHAVHLTSRFEAVVDGTTGDATLKQVVSHLNSTTVSAVGRVISTPERRGKTVIVNLAVRKGRVEDLLLLFTHASTPAMKGPISLDGRFTIPPGPPDFLTRLKINGNFEIAGGQFTKWKTQTPINRLSASATGESKGEQANDPAFISAAIRASVSGRGGIASLPNVTFEAPGIQGRLRGTFTLRDRHINFDGIVRTRGKLSDTTSGVKKVIFKALGPLWSKGTSVQSIPFHIGGNASHPVFRLKLKG